LNKSSLNKVDYGFKVNYKLALATMKVQDNHGSLVKTKKKKNILITYSTLDQDLNLLLKQVQMQDGGKMVTELEVKNGMQSKRLPDSLKIKI